MSTATPTVKVNLTQQLIELDAADAELFANIVTTTNESAKMALATTFAVSAPATIDIATAAGASLVTTIVANTNPVIQSLTALVAPAILQSKATQIYNFFYGSLFGAAPLAALTATE